MKNLLRLRSVLLLSAVFMAVSVIPGCKEKAPPTSAPPAASNPDPATPPPVSPEDLSPITGEAMTKPGSPVAVSIDNHPDARPQTGLNEADIVYEILAEGGITRYLAIFHGQSPKTLGPVRSSRPYFALLAKEWEAVFGHCGGDPNLEEYISEWNVVDANEFGYGHLYWRDDSREAPHNLYGSVENLRKVPAGELPAPTKRYEFTEWASSPETGLEIKYGKSYAVRYEYADGCYNRYILDGSPKPCLHADRESKEPIEASNVIIQFAHSEVVDSEGRLDIDLIGEGKAVFLLGGAYSEGSWKKTSAGEPTFFYSSDGQKIRVARGQTWVQVVPENASVAKVQIQ